ncbi:siroheme synthase CysG [Ancylobacter amanitiformis]|uniref:Uroporphyrin-III C-methyltransferase/precorrin-2 dehydrogenase/sirohydrochlorin ferrochelatase n=1 Tax=Ancylobacter amanitiformis TaxID=217069 RepID=A0ABU0LTG1_9HYPH|nr:siroheme synthase CysG [Ancylobacter amanitiformis]MDQ0511981.1 uroporphyrin-III C-methyltransferase/precorrin-2 dehydrogenase/sirohydrochlorin ferrochelatase [Ancylobacter amanitiformis]
MSDAASLPPPPRKASPAGSRMAPLARLPVFFALDGRRVVLAGGSEAASWKAELLSAAGAVVDVYSPAPCEDLAALAQHPPGGPVRLIARDWQKEDLAGAALAIGAIEDDAAGDAFARAARAAGVPVNVVDKPAFCDFAFGAIVNRSPLVVGISTDGAAPVFGQAVRAKIEAVLPQGFKRWAEAARSWRPSVSALALSYQGRRRFWERFTACALETPEAEPSPTLREELLARAQSERADAPRGSVALVGAGPGDPELLTLKAVRVLQSADVVLYDDLVAPAVLDVARREAKKMLVGKTGYRPSCKQDDINALMVALARQGKRVVRLKGGDPMMFGRAGEEISAAREAGIPVEVVPGISAAQGASSRLAVSLTHRDHARRLQFITAHARDGKLPRDLDWSALADPAATTVVYMPQRTWAELAAKAMAAGLDPATPAIAIFSATRPDERQVPATVATLALALEQAVADGATGPCLILFGHAMGEAAAFAAPLPAAADAADAQIGAETQSARG